MGVSRRVQKRPISVYEKYGFTSRAERFGEHTSGDVCYIGVQSFCAYELGINVGIALIRKLMKKEGYDYTHPDQFIVPGGQGSSAISGGLVANQGPYGIQILYREISSLNPGNEDSVSVGMDYDWYNPSATNSSRTLREFGTWFYSTVLAGGNFGGPTVANRLIFGYRMKYLDYTVAAADPGGAALNRYGNTQSLEKQYLRAYAYTTLRIQNQTHADAGGAVHDAQNVTANPLVGKVFRFKDRFPILYSYQGADNQLGPTATYGNPVMASNVWKIQHDMNLDGMMLYTTGPGATGYADGWDHVPKPSQFQNCVATEKVYLKPGGITEVRLKFKFDGLLQKFISGFGALPAGKIAAVNDKAYGTCLLLALEKVMPDTQGDPIVAFDCEVKYGAIFGKRLSAVMPQWNYPGTTAIKDDAPA